MNYNQLKLIDFSQGIKSSEVMHNDLALQEQIERERLAIAGSGVNYGLEMSINDFSLSVTSGTVIDKDGKERFINGKDVKINLPNIILKKQRIFSTNKGEIVLDEIPYSETRREPSEFTSEKDMRGIDAYYEDSQGMAIAISGIKDKTIYTAATDTKRAVIVNYYVAYDRIDTIYVDKNYTIKVSHGVDSTTPSAFIPEDCKYVLGFVKIVSHYFEEKVQHSVAKAFIIKEFGNRRSVYTDSENNLYLEGIPFESLLKIYFEEPKNPKEGMLWYDMDTNKLKIWRRTDHFMFTDVLTYSSIDPNNYQKFSTSVGYKMNQLSVYKEDRNVMGDIIWTKFPIDRIEYYTDLRDDEKGVKESQEFRIISKLVVGTKIKYTINRYDESYYWVPVNDTTFISMLEYKMWCPDENDASNLKIYLPGLNLDEMEDERKGHDFKTFLFKSDDLHMRFTPYKNELNILIDQTLLHRDQFIEITLEDILADPNGLGKMAINDYGYTNEYLQNLKIEYENVGLGFRFVNSLDRACFIEAQVQHRVNDSILKNKFQRNACFAKSETIVYDPTNPLPAYEQDQTKIKISTAIPYRYGEEQLDVFVYGIKLKKELVTEVTETPMIGAQCKSFAINPVDVGIANGGEIYYKITTNVYSYDHVDSAIKEHQQLLQDKVEDLERKIEIMQRQLENLLG